MRLEVVLLPEHDEGRIGRTGEHPARDEIEDPFREARRQVDLEPEPAPARLLPQRLRLGDVTLPLLRAPPIRSHFVGVVRVAHRPLPDRPPGGRTNISASGQERKLLSMRLVSAWSRIARDGALPFVGA